MWGKKTGDESIAAVKRIITAHPEVKAVGDIKSMHIGSRSSIIAAEVDFTDTLRDIEIQTIKAAIKKEIKLAVPEATHIYLTLSWQDINRGNEG